MERENIRYWEDQDGVTVVWDIVDGINEVYFEYPDGETEIIWTGKDHAKAQKVFSGTLEYLQ